MSLLFQIKFSQRIALLLISVSLLLSACASTKPLKMEVSIQAVSYLNPNIFKQASPVLISIYQLKSPTAFQQANFFTLYNNPASSLGSDLLDKRDIEIRPQQKQTLDIIMSPITNYVGVIAAFRNPDQAQWRQILQITPRKNTDLQINVATQNIELKNN